VFPFLQTCSSAGRMFAASGSRLHYYHELFRFHNDEFDEMSCKLHSTTVQLCGGKTHLFLKKNPFSRNTQPRSRRTFWLIDVAFEKYPTPLSANFLIDWCCFYYFIRISLWALLKALCARIFPLDSWISVFSEFCFWCVCKVSNKAFLPPLSTRILCLVVVIPLVCWLYMCVRVCVPLYVHVKMCG